MALIVNSQVCIFAYMAPLDRRHGSCAVDGVMNHNLPLYRQLEKAQTSSWSRSSSSSPRAQRGGAIVSHAIIKQLSAKQRRVEALEQAARAAQAQHKTDLAEQRQQIWQLQQQLSDLRPGAEAHIHGIGSPGRAALWLHRPLLQDASQLSASHLQELLADAQRQLAEQAEQIARLQQEAVAADKQLEKLANLLQAHEAHSQRLEMQLDSKADAAKSRFAKVSQHLEAERRTVKALRAELQSLTASTGSHVSRLATELEAKQGLLRGLQSTVFSAKADAESSRSQAEAASSALACLRDAGADLERVSAQLNLERQVRHCCLRAN